MSYNYLESMKEDIKNYIKENHNLEEVEDLTEFEEQLNDDLWTEDSVTGNASGSYTFCRATAKEYVKDNLDLMMEMCREFDVDNETIGSKLRDDEYEWIDVSIRRYLLNQAIHEAVDELIQLMAETLGQTCPTV